MLDSEQIHISPDDFYTLMLKKLPFGDYRQHDCQEFLRSLLDCVHEELAKGKGRPVIMNTFQGTFASQVKCTICGSVSIKKEAFLDLSIPLAAPTLEECIAAFVSPEMLDGDDLYHCDNCDKLVPAVKQLILEKVPPVITFQ